MALFTASQLSLRTAARSRHHHIPMGHRKKGKVWVSATFLSCTELFRRAGFKCGQPPQWASRVSQLVKNPPRSIPGWGKSPGERIGYPLRYSWASLVAQAVKNLPAMGETWVQSLGGEDPLEEDMATHSSILAWRIPVDRGAWRAAVHGVTELDVTARPHANP